MIASVLPIAIGMECRACGSTEAPCDSNALPHICGWCWNAFKRYAPTSDDPDDVRLNRWLATQVYKELRRVKLNGVGGRCEAISGIYGRHYYSSGNQCGMWATGLRDGRRVCGSHSKAINVIWVGEPANDLYARMTLLLSELAAQDDEFKQCLREALGMNVPPSDEGRG